MQAGAGQILGTDRLPTAGTHRGPSHKPSFCNTRWNWLPGTWGLWDDLHIPVCSGWVGVARVWCGD